MSERLFQTFSARMRYHRDQLRLMLVEMDAIGDCMDIVDPALAEIGKTLNANGKIEPISALPPPPTDKGEGG